MPKTDPHKKVKHHMEPENDSHTEKNDFKAASKFSAHHLVAFIVAFALIGGFFLIKSFAASPVIASTQAENMLLPSGATIINDVNASGGQAVRLTTSGTSLSGAVSLPSQATSLTVAAHGNKCRGNWPYMTVKVDNNTLLNNQKVASNNWTSYSANTNLASGTHSLTITGSNLSTCGRYLYVDVANFFGPTPPPPQAPTVSLSASPSAVTAGQSSTLTWNSTNATSCSASGAWSGSQPTSGSQSTGSLNQTSTYTLSCTGSGGTAQASTTITVSSSGGGGGTGSALWTGDMEEGNLADWYNPATCECTNVNHNGGEFNSGGGDTVASQTFAHSGSWSAKQTINTSAGSSGTRLFRWGEFRTLQAGQGLYESAWIYIPQNVTVGGYFNIDQFKSKTQDGAYVDVFFQLNLRNRSGGGLYLSAAWGCGAENPSFPLGPYANSTAADNCNFFTPLNTINVPVGQWFKLTTYTVPSAGHNGVFKAWQDGTLIYDFQNVQTGYSNTNSLNGVDTQWAINAYASGLTPTTYSHYVDDVSVSSSGP